MFIWLELNCGPLLLLILLTLFFKKMGESRPLLVYFRYFLITIFSNTKCWWCAWVLNPGPQDGRRRRNHGAMLATPSSYSFDWNIRPTATIAVLVEDFKFSIFFLSLFGGENFWRSKMLHLGWRMTTWVGWTSSWHWGSVFSWRTLVAGDEQPCRPWGKSI